MGKLEEEARGCRPVAEVGEHSPSMPESHSWGPSPIPRDPQCCSFLARARVAGKDGNKRHAALSTSCFERTHRLLGHSFSRQAGLGRACRPEPETRIPVQVV